MGYGYHQLIEDSAEIHHGRICSYRRCRFIQVFYCQSADGMSDSRSARHKNSRRRRCKYFCSARFTARGGSPHFVERVYSRRHKFWCAISNLSASRISASPSGRCQLIHSGFPSGWLAHQGHCDSAFPKFCFVSFAPIRDCRQLSGWRLSVLLLKRTCITGKEPFWLVVNQIVCSNVQTDRWCSS